MRVGRGGVKRRVKKHVVIASQAPSPFTCVLFHPRNRFSSISLFLSSFHITINSMQGSVYSSNLSRLLQPEEESASSAALLFLTVSLILTVVDCQVRFGRLSLSNVSFFHHVCCLGLHGHHKCRNFSMQKSSPRIEAVWAMLRRWGWGHELHCNARHTCSSVPTLVCLLPLLPAASVDCPAPFGVLSVSWSCLSQE